MSAIFRTASVAVALAISACAAPPSGPLPSNQFSFSATSDKTKEALVLTFVGAGYSIKTQSENQLIFDRQEVGTPAAFWYGTRMYPNPYARVNLTIAGSAPTTVIAQAGVASNPGSGFEKYTDFTNNAQVRADLAKRMNEAKALLNAQTGS